MGKTKILKEGWGAAPNAFYVSAMRTTDNNNAAVECANQQWQQATALFHTTFMTLDNAYQRSMVSFSTQTIAEKDEERDQWGQVIEQVAKQWMRMPDPAMAIHGRRVYQVFQDIGFRASEALVAENEKVTNIEQRLSVEAALGLALQTMGLTEANRRFATLTQEIVTLMQERNLENSTRVQGELKAAREKMDEVYADYVELTNALIVTGTRRTAWTRRRSTRWWRWTARPLAKSCQLSRSKYSVKSEQCPGIITRIVSGLLCRYCF